MKKESMSASNSGFLVRAFLVGDALRVRDLFPNGVMEFSVEIKEEAHRYSKYLLADDLADIPTHY